MCAHRRISSAGSATPRKDSAMMSCPRIWKRAGVLRRTFAVVLRQVLVILEIGVLYTRLSTACAVREQDLARRVAGLEALRESAGALASSLDRDQILQVLATNLVRALGAAHAAFTHVDMEARRCASLVHEAVPGHAPLFAVDSRGSLDDYPELEGVLRRRTPFYGRIDAPDF